ncbi:MAG: radical SAM protein [Thermoanaerobaculales bacterium]
MSAWPFRYEEPVFRPPSEARSLILQATVGCSWNRCTYCAMYRGKTFRVRSLDEIVGEIRSTGPLAAQVQRVFLADGDALAAPQELLEAVLEEIRETLPQVYRVGIYADSRSILKKGADGLKALRGLGLGIVYFGAESGDEATLQSVRKGATVERQLAACELVREAGLKLSVMVLLGLAGVEGSERHARATGRFLVRGAPTYGAALTVTPVSGTEFHDAVESGVLELPDRWDMLQELFWMLEEMGRYRGPFHANHASNYLPLKLRLPRDRAPAMEHIQRVLSDRDDSRLTPEWARGL